MNRGDAQVLALHITINGEPIEPDYADEIELTFNPELHGFSVRKTLSGGGIQWEEDTGQYIAALSQQDTFTLRPGRNSWQLRLLKEGMVISTCMGELKLGDVNSKRILAV